MSFSSLCDLWSRVYFRGCFLIWNDARPKAITIRVYQQCGRCVSFRHIFNVLNPPSFSWERCFPGWSRSTATRTWSQERQKSKLPLGNYYLRISKSQLAIGSMCHHVVHVPHESSWLFYMSGLFANRMLRMFACAPSRPAARSERAGDGEHKGLPSRCKSAASSHAGPIGTQSRPGHDDMIRHCWIIWVATDWQCMCLDKDCGQFVELA